MPGAVVRSIRRKPMVPCEWWADDSRRTSHYCDVEAVDRDRIGPGPCGRWQTNDDVMRELAWDSIGTDGQPHEQHPGLTRAELAASAIVRLCAEPQECAVEHVALQPQKGCCVRLR